MTENELLVSAIRRLRPNAEFSIIGGDYSTIKWDVLEGTAPTLNQINSAKKEIQSEIENLEKSQLAAAESAMNKLAAIGLTPDEIAALRG